MVFILGVAQGSALAGASHRLSRLRKRLAAANRIPVGSHL